MRTTLGTTPLTAGLRTIGEGTPTSRTTAAQRPPILCIRNGGVIERLAEVDETPDRWRTTDTSVSGPVPTPSCRTTAFRRGRILTAHAGWPRVRI